MPTTPTLPEAPISLTSKSGKGYDADMLTIRGIDWESFDSLGRSVYGDDVWEGKLDGLTKVPTDTASAAPAASSGGGSSSGGGDWQDNPPTCSHGLMQPRQWTAKTGPKSGQPQYTFFCPQPREANDKCSPVDALTRKPWGAK